MVPSIKTASVIEGRLVGSEIVCGPAPAILKPMISLYGVTAASGLAAVTALASIMKERSDPAFVLLVLKTWKSMATFSTSIPAMGDSRSLRVITMVSVTTVLSFGVNPKASPAPWKRAALISANVPTNDNVPSVPSRSPVRPIVTLLRNRSPFVTLRSNWTSAPLLSGSSTVNTALTRSLAPSVLVNPPNPLPSKIMSRPGRPTPRLFTVKSLSGSGLIAGGILTLNSEVSRRAVGMLFWT